MTTLTERTHALVGAEPRRTVRHLPWLVLLVDLSIITVAGMLAIVFRAQLSMLEPSDIESTLDVAGPLTQAGWAVAIAIAGGYQREIFGNGPDEFKRVWYASVTTAGLTGVGCYLAKFDLSRGYFLLFFVVGLPSLFVGRWAVRQLLHGARRHGYLQVRVLVSGSPAHIDEVTGVLRRESWLGYSVVGAVTPQDTVLDETATGVPLLGGCDDIVSVAQQVGADIIFFAGGGMASGTALKELLWDLEEHDISVVVSPDMNDISTDRLTVRPVGGLPLIHVEGSRWAKASRLGKRSFDIAGSMALLVAFSPLLIAASIAIWAHDRRPVLFKQTRVGRHGQTFACYKFRTMVPDAEARLATLKARLSDDPVLFKLADDPRVTRPGRFLRRFSIDELPQLLNVLRGDMSLVGPRPPLPTEVARYEASTHRRLHVRPGMTGLWQVSGRSDLPWEEAVRLDLYYVDNWSMLQDLNILVRTLGAVVGSRGAY